MNKIHKTIWNSDKKTWIAVSELCSHHASVVGSSSLVKIFAYSFLLMMQSPSFAQYAAGNGTASGVDSIAIGLATASTGASVAIGTNSVAGILPGTSSSIAIGTQSTAAFSNSIAIGSDATSSADSSVALGAMSATSNGAVLALGSHVTASGINSLALGEYTTASGKSSLALGGHATVSGDYSIALGDSSVDVPPTSTNSVSIGGLSYSASGTNPVGVLSIGNNTEQREIINVAAGVVSQNSTDAINGSELYAVIQGVNSLSTSASTGISTAQSGVNSLSTGLSTTNSNVASLST
ncbi:ESPR-type extended signal peptide-containing protein, partial [Burkholderia cepacia]|uniref:ESPR-type extended signal peptide-containing protein n=1 Tax=Burkholderia cepacia TaxID=292 RepID=UPI000A593632